MRKIKLTLVLIAIVLFAASPAMAGSWYIGGGLDFVSVGDELNSIDSGVGLVFDFGYRFSPNMALDMSLSSSAHEEVGYDIDYGRFSIGPKFIFPTESFDPFVTVGLMSHVIDYELINYEIDGAGIFLGFGIDMYFAPTSSLTISYVTTSWEGEDNFGFTGDVQTGILRGAYVYHFLQ